MNRRDRVVVAVLVVVLAVFAGALALPRHVAVTQGEEPTPDFTQPPRVVFREGVVGTARAERALVGLVFSGLVRLGPGATYQPDLAESWTVDDTGKTWTFTLRDDAVWHDGVPVTADDVVFTVNALKSPDATRAPALGRTSPSRPSTTGRCGSRSGRPSAACSRPRRSPCFRHTS